MKIATATVALMRRYNLGNYEHAEGRIEVTVSDVTDPDRAIAEAQALLHRHLRAEAVVGKPPAAPVAPAAPAADDPAALRAAIRAAVEADPERQAAVIAMMTEARVARLGQADLDLLRRIAAKVGAV